MTIVRHCESLLLALFVVGCAAPEQPPSLVQAKSRDSAQQPSRFDPSLYSGGDGSSCDQAVVLLSRSEVRGIGSEYVWLDHKFPGGKRQMQSLTPWNDQGKRYDILEWRKSDGELVTLCFDISNMYR